MIPEAVLSESNFTPTFINMFTYFKEKRKIKLGQGTSHQKWKHYKKKWNSIEYKIMFFC